MQGVAGPSFQGDIALDDLILVDGNCPSDLPFECSFEDSSICGFTVDTTQPIRWIRNKGIYTYQSLNEFYLRFSLGRILGTSYGPTVDHTTATNTGF